MAGVHCGWCPNKLYHERRTLLDVYQEKNVQISKVNKSYCGVGFSFRYAFSGDVIGPKQMHF